MVCWARMFLFLFFLCYCRFIYSKSFKFGNTANFEYLNRIPNPESQIPNWSEYIREKISANISANISAKKYRRIYRRKNHLHAPNFFFFSRIVSYLFGQFNIRWISCQLSWNDKGQLNVRSWRMWTGFIG